MAKINGPAIIFIFGVTEHNEKSHFTLKGAHNRNLRPILHKKQYDDIHLAPIHSIATAHEKNIPLNGSANTFFHVGAILYIGISN